VRDTLAGRALLNSLPLPVWFRHSDGRIEWVNEAYVKAVEARDGKEVRERQIELLENAPARVGAGHTVPRVSHTGSGCISSAAARARRTTW